MRPPARPIYRIRQFLQAISRRCPPDAEAILARHLSPALSALFRRMAASEQAHALAVLARLQERGCTDPDLLAAALLHDVGKVRLPLSTPDRVLIVLAKRFLPQAAARWGQGEGRGFKRPFVTAARHAAWGAELAQAAGASERTCALIRKHQDEPEAGDDLLSALQEADDDE
jgi:predicted HD phosphohydrolase